MDVFANLELVVLALLVIATMLTFNFKFNFGVSIEVNKGKATESTYTLAGEILDRIPFLRRGRNSQGENKPDELPPTTPAAPAPAN